MDAVDDRRRSWVRVDRESLLLRFHATPH
jgi:hypothetical protein